MIKLLLAIVLVVYGGGYSLFRALNSETAPDGGTVVVYPDDPTALYYAFRPAAYVDQMITGAEARIGEGE